MYSYKWSRRYPKTGALRRNMNTTEMISITRLLSKMEPTVHVKKPSPVQKEPADQEWPTCFLPRTSSTGSLETVAAKSVGAEAATEVEADDWPKRFLPPPDPTPPKAARITIESSARKAIGAPTPNQRLRRKTTLRNRAAIEKPAKDVANQIKTPAKDVARQIEKPAKDVAHQIETPEKDVAPDPDARGKKQLQGQN